MRIRSFRFNLILLAALLSLSLGGCQQVRRVSNAFAGKTPGYYARRMQHPSANRRWQAINHLVDTDFGKRPPYTTRYRQIAQSDPDPMVRAIAIRALNRSREPGNTELFIEALGDPNEQVRLEAVKALINVPDPAAAQPLLAVLNRPEETLDVRIAATEALKHYKRLEVARALVARLNERDFGVAWQARRSLRRMTQQDFGYNEGAWLSYFTGPENPFS